MILIFDTETTGFVEYKKPASSTEQPYLVELAAILCEPDGTKRGSIDMIVSPFDWQIPEDAIKVHGITEDIARNCGASRRQVLDTFCAMADIADMFVCHGWGFDRKVMKAALYREGMDANFVDEKEHFCTMSKGQKYFHQPNWVKLAWLHQELFGEPVPHAHSAMGDANATRRCFFKIWEPPKSETPPLVKEPAGSNIIAGPDAPLEMTPGRPVTEKRTKDKKDAKPFDDELPEQLGAEDFDGMGL